MIGYKEFITFSLNYMYIMHMETHFPPISSYRDMFLRDFFRLTTLMFIPCPLSLCYSVICKYKQSIKYTLRWLLNGAIITTIGGP